MSTHDRDPRDLSLPQDNAMVAPSLWLYVALVALSLVMIVLAFSEQDRPDWPGLLLNLAAGLLGAVVVLVVVDKKMRSSELRAIQGIPARAAAFLRSLSPAEQKQRLEKDATEVVEPPAAEQPVSSSQHDQNAPKPNRLSDHVAEFERVEARVIGLLEAEFGEASTRGVGIGNTGAFYSALFGSREIHTFVAVKLRHHPETMNLQLKETLYNAVLASQVLRSKFHLILVFVYTFDPQLLPAVERSLRSEVGLCPASIELRFYQRVQIDA